MSVANKKGDTCMNLAIQSGREEMVSYLLSASPRSLTAARLLPLLVQAITSGQSQILVFKLHAPPEA